MPAVMFFKDNIWGVDLANMCKLNIVFNKHVWSVPLKDEKDVTTTNAFQKISGKCRRKPNKS